MVTGTVVGIKARSFLSEKKHLLEIELDEHDSRLLQWQSKRVKITRV